MTVLVLGLTVGLIIKKEKASAYHSRMIAYMVNLSTYSIVLTHYFLWATSRFPQEPRNDRQGNAQTLDPMSITVQQKQKSVLQLKGQRAIYLVTLAGVWITSIALDLGNGSSLEEEYACIPWKSGKPGGSTLPCSTSRDLSLNSMLFTRWGC